MASYCVDIVFCVDLTAGMNDLLEQFKDNCTTIANRISDKIENTKGNVQNLRVKIIGFRDFVEEEAVIESQFFELPDEVGELLQFIELLDAHGGGDTPENALEALALALKSPWTEEGDRRRHVIFMITDSYPVRLGERSEYPNYLFLGGMPKDMDELTSWYQQGIGTLDLRARRFVLFAPEHHSWDTISQTWDHCVYFKLEHNMEITDYMDQLERIICFNI